MLSLFAASRAKDGPFYCYTFILQYGKKIFIIRRKKIYREHKETTKNAAWAKTPNGVLFSLANTALVTLTNW